MTFQWPLLLVAVALVPLGVLAARSIDRRRRARVADLGGLGRATGGPAGGTRGARGSGGTRGASRLASAASTRPDYGTFTHLAEDLW